MFNENRSCIEIAGGIVLKYNSFRLMKTEVVLKSGGGTFFDGRRCPFNENRSCIEINLD